MLKTVFSDQSAPRLESAAFCLDVNTWGIVEERFHSGLMQEWSFSLLVGLVANWKADVVPAGYCGGNKGKKKGGGGGEVHTNSVNVQSTFILRVPNYCVRFCLINCYTTVLYTDHTHHWFVTTHFALHLKTPPSTYTFLCNQTIFEENHVGCEAIFTVV